MTDEQRKWISQQDYEGLLRKWRFEPIASSYFCDNELNDYFKKRLDEAKYSLTIDEQVAISKRIGWES